MENSEHELRIFDHFLSEFLDKKSPQKPLLVGINGIDGSGKTTITKKLAGFLEQQGQKTEIIHIDDFHNPKEIRYAGEKTEAYKYFYQSFALDTLIQELLSPIKTKGILEKSLNVLNLESNAFDTTRNYQVTPETIVLFEGVFLFREELVSYLDYKILIDIPFSESKKRAMLRSLDLTEYDLIAYDQKYTPAQRKYFEEYKPKEIADLVIDNRNFEKPKIIK